MPFPFKANSSCTSPPLDAPSTIPWMGLQSSAGPSSSGGTAAMLTINTTCQCSKPCCGDGGGGGPAGGGSPLARFAARARGWTRGIAVGTASWRGERPVVSAGVPLARWRTLAPHLPFGHPLPRGEGDQSSVALRMWSKDNSSPSPRPGGG